MDANLPMQRDRLALIVKICVDLKHKDKRQGRENRGWDVCGGVGGLRDGRGGVEGGRKEPIDAATEKKSVFILIFF